MLDVSGAARLLFAAVLRLVVPYPGMQRDAGELATAIALVMDGQPRSAQLLALAAVIHRMADELDRASMPTYHAQVLRRR